MPWFDNFGWYLEIGGVQKEVLKKWNDHPPDFVLRGEPKGGNWYDLAVYQPKEITDYIQGNYENEGEIWENVFLWKRVRPQNNH